MGLLASADLLAARIQMALTLGFHIVFACFGVGLPLLLFLAELRYLRSGDAEWRLLARRWARAFAVLFAVGAVSGTVLSFELGVLWPRFMETFGPVFGLAFSLEAIAFFIEAIFVGIYLYGWDRLPPRRHALAAIPIAVSGFASAAFVVTVNAWMNAPDPASFRLEDGVLIDADPLAAMLGPTALIQAIHMILAAYMVTGFGLASYYAWRQLRGFRRRYERRAMGLSLMLGCVCAPLQMLSGDVAARVVAETQPVKLAAMEAHFETGPAPLFIGGIPDAETGELRYALAIPGGLSWLIHRDAAASIQGLNEVPKDERPPVAIVHIAFQVMVGGGGYLLALALASAALALWRWRRGKGRIREAQGPPRLFLLAVLLSGPVAVAAMEAGWVVTEVGRQPWIVQGVMRTAEAATTRPWVIWILAATSLLYLGLTIGAVMVLRRLGEKPLGDGEGA